MGFDDEGNIIFMLIIDPFVLRVSSVLIYFSRSVPILDFISDDFWERIVIFIFKGGGGLLLGDLYGFC